MAIKHVYKSLASINKKKNFVELMSILVNTSMYFNCDFDFIFFSVSTQYNETGEVKHGG